MRLIVFAQLWDKQRNKPSGDRLAETGGSGVRGGGGTRRGFLHEPRRPSSEHHVCRGWKWLPASRFAHSDRTTGSTCDRKGARVDSGTPRRKRGPVKATGARLVAFYFTSYLINFTFYYIHYYYHLNSFLLQDKQQVMSPWSLFEDKRHDTLEKRFLLKTK